MPKTTKPKKPYPGFPLFPHATGRWAKKIRGRFHYFGPWDDPDGAMQLYQQQRDDLHAGREPATPGDRPTLHEVCLVFWKHHQKRCEAGEITEHTFRGNFATCKMLLETLGKNISVEDIRPSDLAKVRAKITKTRKSVATANAMQRVRSVFSFAYDEGLIDKPIRYGQSFNRPSKREIRLERNARGELMFEAHEVRAMLFEAKQPLKAMILLGINCGFGNSDVATLTTSSVDLNNGWIDHPRPKTGVRRHVPLWPETIEAVAQAADKRPHHKNKEHAELFFITKYGNSFSKTTSQSPITQEAKKLLGKLEMHRRGLGFYTLRRTFETVAGDAKDQVAVDAIMGHAKDDMASVYRQKVFEKRLRDVVNHVRSWLFERSME